MLKDGDDAFQMPFCNDIVHADCLRTSLNGNTKLNECPVCNRPIENFEI